MIITVGSFMKDTIRDWFDVQDKQMRKLQIVDNYKSFIESMDFRFKNDNEVQIAARKLWQVKYSSNILKYLNTLQQPHMKVWMSGVMWRDLIKEVLPVFILHMLTLTQGGEPQNDDALILCIKDHGLNYKCCQGKKSWLLQHQSVPQLLLERSASAVEGALVPLLQANNPLALLLRSSCR